MAISPKVKKTAPRTLKQKVVDVILDKHEYVVTVTIESSVYQGTGSTALEALQSVPAPTLDLISSGSVKISHGDKSKEMYFAAVPMKRLLNPFNQPMLIIDLQEGL